MMRSVASLLAMTLLLAVASLVAGAGAGSNPGVLQLDTAGFRAQVARPMSLSLVSFCTRGTPRCRELTSILPAVLKGVAPAAGAISVASVDCASNADLCTEMNVASPDGLALKLIPGSAAGGKVASYKLPTSTAPKSKEVAEWALASMPNHVQLLTGAGEKSSPRDKSKARVLLFTDKRETSTLYKSIALALHPLADHVVVAEVRKAEKGLFNRYEIGKSLPVLMVEPPLLAGGEERSPRRFEGKMDKQLIIAFVATFLPEGVTLPVEGAQGANAAASGADASAAPSAANGAAAASTISELVDQSCLEKYCGGSLCLLMALPKSSPSLAQHQSQLALMDQSVRSDQSSGRVRFVYVDSEKHGEWLQSNFDLQPQEYPQLLLLSVRKARFAAYLGAFEVNAVREFVRDLAKGRVKTIPFVAPQGKLLPLPEGTACPPEVKEEKKSSSSSSSSSRTRPAKEEPVKEEGEVHALNLALHDALVLDSARPWVLLFHSGASASSAAPARESFLKVAKNLKGMIQFGEVDLSDASAATLGGVYGVSADQLDAQAHVAIFSLAAGKKAKSEPSAARTYAIEGAESLEPKALRSWVLELLQGAPVLSPITAQSMQQFMGDLEPNSPFPPKLMFFLKPTGEGEGELVVPDLAKALALEYTPRGVTVGVASSREKDVARQFGVKKIPSVYLMHQAPADMPGLSEEQRRQVAVQATAYEGPITFPHLRAFLERKVREFHAQKQDWAEKAAKAGQRQQQRASSQQQQQEDVENVDLDHDEL